MPDLITTNSKFLSKNSIQKFYTKILYKKLIFCFELAPRKYIRMPVVILRGYFTHVDNYNRIFLVPDGEQTIKKLEILKKFEKGGPFEKKYIRINPMKTSEYFTIENNPTDIKNLKGSIVEIHANFKKYSNKDAYGWSLHLIKMSACH